MRKKLAAYSIVTSLVMSTSLSASGLTDGFESGSAATSQPQTAVSSTNVGLLHEASIARDINALREYIQSGADVNAQDNNGRTPLFDAVESGNIDIINALIAAGANVNVIDRTSYLITDLGDVNFRYFGCKHSDFKTILHRAAEGGNKDIVNALVAAGANVNAQDSSGRTPLFDAVGNKDIVNALVAAGANVNAQDNNGRTPLFDAVKKGSIEIVSALLALGADVRAHTTPLFDAVESGNIDIINALIAAGANVNVKEDFGRSLLHLAVEKGRINIITALAAAGANVNVQDDNGRTPLHLAAYRGGDGNIVNALIALGADVCAEDDEGYTPGEVAEECGHTECLEALDNPSQS